jgi:hypothetical protein
LHHDASSFQVCLRRHDFIRAFALLDALWARAKEDAELWRAIETEHAVRNRRPTRKSKTKAGK